MIQVVCRTLQNFFKRKELIKCIAKILFFVHEKSPENIEFSGLFRSLLYHTKEYKGTTT